MDVTSAPPVVATSGSLLKEPSGKGHFRSKAIAAVVVAVAIGGAAYWLRHRPVEVTVANPVMTQVKETIASSGLVGGVKESVIGASFNGAVVKLFVKLGDHVDARQPLAVLKNDVTQAQVLQAQTAVTTARAQLKQTSRGPLASELQAAQMQVSQARALSEEAAAELNLAQKTQLRSQSLAKAGVISKSELDTATASIITAEAKQRSGTASIRLAEAQLQTLHDTPRKEDVELARDRLTESTQALLVVREQAGEATIVAPFSGVITAVNVELGQNVDALGLFAMVSDELEIRVELDESNLADISLGQTALVSAAAFSGETFEARLKEISPAVNRIRGTVLIKLQPLHAPAWLKSGQTLNVNLVTSPAAERLLIPASALRRSGDRTVVLAVENERAVEKIVLTRPPSEKGVPVLTGLSASDAVILNPLKLQAGDAVRIKQQRIPI